MIDDRWLQVRNVLSTDEWARYAAAFDPVAVLHRLGVPSDELLHAADDLLVGLHRVEPIDADWSELVRRAPPRSWDGLTGELRAALDRRVAAEILLRCYEDLAEGGHVAHIEKRHDVFHAPRERLSHRSASLDANLASLGISPHPGVVLVVEGETEEVLLPLVREHMRLPGEAAMIQSVVLRGVTRDLTKLAAYASAPLVEKQEGED